ncbi:hypothetical protein EKO27_g4694 [Xylaria grammica]|uniref:Retinol dehydrogenase 12 n=1 Tax=Xylaria grammica TaxID=363999 RepID=A0A439D7N3_9PEZI|nr:hypothetical protein EKO27_g4694 [Xylaria grammica]
MMDANTLGENFGARAENLATRRRRPGFFFFFGLSRDPYLGDFRSRQSRLGVFGSFPSLPTSEIYYTFPVANVANSSRGDQFSLDDVPDLAEKVAVVTGGSEGIGYGVTYTLLVRNIAKVYILSTSKEVIKGAKEAITAELGKAAADKTRWIQCDLADWKKTKEVAEQIKKDTDRLDILINNAARGIMTYQLTEYGVDRHMAVNHIGHVVLTSQLLPLMKETARKGNIVRIVNQASNAHQAAPSDTKFESLEELNQDLGPNPQYGRSKLASILYSRHFTRMVTKAGHPNILMNSTHPGFVSTKMSKQDILEPFPLGGYAMAIGMEPFKKDQFEGAKPAMYAATVAEDSGQYICSPAVPESGSELAQDDSLADRLMKLTRRILMEKMKSDPSEDWALY